MAPNKALAAIVFCENMMRQLPDKLPKMTTVESRSSVFKEICQILTLLSPLDGWLSLTCPCACTVLYSSHHANYTVLYGS